MGSSKCSQATLAELGQGIADSKTCERQFAKPCRYVACPKRLTTDPPPPSPPPYLTRRTLVHVNFCTNKYAAGRLGYKSQPSNITFPVSSLLDEGMPAPPASPFGCPCFQHLCLLPVVLGPPVCLSIAKRHAFSILWSTMAVTTSPIPSMCSQSGFVWGGSRLRNLPDFWSLWFSA